MYPKVKVRHDDDGEIGLKAFLSLYLQPSSPGSDTDENKVNLRVSSIPPPRAVISSPDNDIMIGNRNKTRDERLSTSKNDAVLQNRHAHCKVRLHDATDIPSDTRKHREPGSKEEIDSVGKKKTHKGSIKIEKVPWRF
ncbi:uncharacterized protein LOC106779836 isoform X3 [Vigna radiata var. radiata]|uniref:Uncharacterized protein LOC106779836 isoform X3 n=1 Tax=Vigna radiata var. radiata TaxID=3916 RepID=A0A3Q0EPW7_VIGRR|nr:uncharacterized protein LOC106779836 isoform X3 [Vigna radiata var. radiata]